MFKKTYQVEAGGPPPMERAHYQAVVEREWRLLLDRNPPEKDVQFFLEQHPAMVPGAFGVGSPSGHAPFPGALISQPELYGYRARKPDFLWFSKNSLSLNPILIEIESPRKSYSLPKGGPRPISPRHGVSSSNGKLGCLHLAIRTHFYVPMV